MKMEQSVPKRRHIKFRRRGITQKKTYIFNTHFCTLRSTRKKRLEILILFFENSLKMETGTYGEKPEIMERTN
jgi:hypothetical protein